MASSDLLELEGVVKEAFPGLIYKVEVLVGESTHTVMAHLSGKLKVNTIRVLPGDKVTVAVSPYDLTKGRITWRHL